MKPKLRPIEKIRLCILIVCVSLLVVGCQNYIISGAIMSAKIAISERNSHFGFDMDDYIIIEYEDNRSLGEGERYYILDCSQNAQKARETVKDWKPLPLSENLSVIMYGGGNRKKGWAEWAKWQPVENGVYNFYNRSIEENPDDDLSLDVTDCNISIAVYDLDKDILYHFDLDR